MFWFFLVVGLLILLWFKGLAMIAGILAAIVWLPLWAVIGLGVVTSLLCGFHLSGTYKDKNYFMPVVWLGVMSAIIGYKFQIYWLHIIFGFAGMFVTGIFYVLPKWYSENKKLYNEIKDKLANVAFPCNERIDVNSDTVFGYQVFNGGLPYATAQEVFKKATPQASRYRGLLWGWALFWPFHLLVDLIPFKLMSELITYITDICQRISDKMFQAA